METSTLNEKIKLLSGEQRLIVEGYVDALLEILNQEESLPGHLKADESKED
jgi:hypothetical protein